MSDENKKEEFYEEIPVEEEEVVDETAEDKKDWGEEFVVAGEELVETVKNLINEAAIRRLVVKNEKHNIHLEVPLVLGIAGIALVPFYAGLALIAALVTECTILVERKEPVEEKEPVVE
jgi:vacuolar-type H+-ATPase subunit I/STV1